MSPFRNSGGQDWYGTEKQSEGANNKLANGDIIGGLLDLTQAGVSARRMMQSCFVAGTPPRGVASSQPIETFRSYGSNKLRMDFGLKDHDRA